MPLPRDGDVVLAVERIQWSAELSGRSHQLQLVADSELLGGEGGERAAWDVLHPDPQFS